MRTKARMLGIAALAIVAIGGGYVITSELHRDDTAVGSGPALDTDSEQARMESVSTPQVSGEFMRLPESQSVAIAPAPRQKSQTTRSAANAD